jgi:REP element-mobilizing transposase RayT
MPRKPRLQAPDVLYHVTTRGVEKRDIFTRGNCYLAFLSLLDQTVERYGWICHAYCLMKNHFHLVVETPHSNISSGMQLLKGEYASWFNAANGREGALYERRFRETNPTGEGALEFVSRYLALNPVAAGFADHPDDWRWSSYNATAGTVVRPRFLTVDRTLDLFGGGALGAAQFSAFVEEGVAAAVAARSEAATSGSDPDTTRRGMAEADRRSGGRLRRQAVALAA